MDKVKFEIEFPIHASPSMLYQYFSTPSGLEEWFADKVNSRGKVITFFWDDSQEQASIISKKMEKKQDINGLKVVTMKAILSLEFKLTKSLKMFH